MTLLEAASEQTRVATALMFGGAEMLREFVAGVGITFDRGDFALRILLTMDDPLGLVRAAVDVIAPMIPFDFVITGGFAFLNGGPAASPGARIARGNGSGTLGAVARKSTGELVLLTCAHVLFSDGDVESTNDNGDTTVIARSHTVDFITFDDQPIPFDAGIARLISPTIVSPRFPPHAVTSTAVLEPAENMHIEHYGVNGHRRAAIGLLKTTLNVDDGGDSYTFASCALTPEDFADHGDSGSLGIDTATHRPVGIVFAKATTEAGSYVALCSLSAALAHWNLTLLIE